MQTSCARVKRGPRAGLTNTLTNGLAADARSPPAPNSLPFVDGDSKRTHASRLRESASTLHRAIDRASVAMPMHARCLAGCRLHYTAESLHTAGPRPVQHTTRPRGPSHAWPHGHPLPWAPPAHLSGPWAPSIMGTPAHLSGQGPELALWLMFLRQEGRTRVGALVEGDTS